MQDPITGKYATYKLISVHYITACNLTTKNSPATFGYCIYVGHLPAGGDTPYSITSARHICSIYIGLLFMVYCLWLARISEFPIKSGIQQLKNHKPKTTNHKLF